MRKLCATTMAAVALLAACGGDVEEPSDRPGDEPAGRPADEGGAAACDPELGDVFAAWAEAGFSGSVAVVAGGEPRCLAAYGLADREAGRDNTVDTVFGIGSVSKAFTAAAVLGLVENGLVAPSDRAGDLVPGLGGPAAEVTVEQLLVHTSGLMDGHGADHQPLSRDEAVAAIGELPVAFAPGSDYQYSNAGYTLLALVVEEVADGGYRDHLASEVLPLPGGEVAGGFWDGEPAAPGPRAVGYTDEGPSEQTGDFEGPHWALAGNGDLAMTTGDLAAWAHALFTGQILGPEGTEAAARPGFDHGGGAAEVPGWVAVDESAYGVPLLASSGGGGDLGHEATVMWAPEEEMAIAIASNTPDIMAGELAELVGPALFSGESLPTPELVGDVPAEDAEAVAGDYTLSSGGSFTVAGRDGRLAVSASGPDAVAALFPPPEDVTADDVAAHEQAVTALLAGETETGRRERAALEEESGPLGDVEVIGTLVEDGELRTYVSVGTGSGPVTAWYAVDDGGGIAGVDVGVDPPTLLLGEADGGGYRPDDPAGTGPDVTVELTEGGMTISGPAGTTSARPAE